MLHSKSFVKRTRKGTVLKVVREHYLRDDISCGSLSCTSETCDKDSACLSADASQLLVVDTNVALHQIDLLENAAVSDVVVLSIVLEEVKHKNLSAYNRLRALCSNPAKRFFVFSNEHHRETFIKAEAGESPNDRNDRAIRVAAAWYSQHLKGTKVVLISNDAENLRKAAQEGLVATNVQQFVKSLGQPELLDLVAATGGGEGVDGDGKDEGGDVIDTRPSKRKVLFAEHKPMSEITAGLQRGLFYQGKIRLSRYNPQEAYVGSESLGDEIVIHGRQDLNRGVDGDIVAVELLPPDCWREAGASRIAEGDDEDEDEEDVAGLAPGAADSAAGPGSVQNPPSGSGRDSKPGLLARPTGRVVGIIKRNWRTYCGSLEPMASAPHDGAKVNALFVSTDRRIPKVRVLTRQFASLVSKRIMVAIDSWHRTSAYPSGHYVRTLGDIGDRSTESEVLLIENDINMRPFSQQVLACLPPLPWSVPPDATLATTREDLRSIRAFSVDPPGCRDIDDALHCTRLPGGNFAVGVHIADVTNFVLPGTPLDEEASQRGTSTYLVERRIDMLPKPLTEDICSLRADVERFAFSVLWEMTPDAEIVSKRFTKSVIKSCAALSYVEAQARMDDSRLLDDLTEDLRNMNRLAKVMRQRRIDRGALTLASPEVKFEIDTETHDPLDVGMYQVREANQMVEEFMLAANISVAEKILSAFPTCSLLRRHPTPTPKMYEPLLRIAAAVGISLDISSSRALADSLDRAVGSDPYFNKLIRILATRCMTQAVYFPSGEVARPEFHHYGLAAPLYTHFTSPIRRYADVIVHRLLAAALGLSPLPHQMRDKAALNSVSDNLNYRHRNAQMAGRASVELHTLIYFRTRPMDAEARIVMVKANGLIVFVPKFGIEGPVYLNPKEHKEGEQQKKSQVGGDMPASLSARWLVDEEHQIVKSADGKKQYRVLDTISVHIEIIQPQPNRFKLALTLLDHLGQTDTDMH